MGTRGGGRLPGRPWGSVEDASIFAGPCARDNSISTARGCTIGTVAEDVAGFSSAVEVELPRGLALNSVRIVCPGEHLVTRFVKPHDYSREWRRRLEARIGRPV